MEFMKDLMEKIEFPDEANRYFCDLYASLGSAELRFFREQEDTYYSCKENNIEEIIGGVQKALDNFALKKGISNYTVHMLFLLMCTEKLHSLYNAENIPENLFYDLMCDLKYKLIECKKMYDVWGSFVFGWFHRHFRRKLFALGRFQYETEGFLEKEYKFGDFTIKKGDTVYNFHIPSSGSIGDDERINSYKQAYEFFGFKNGEIIPFVCESWLLFPENKNIFPSGSNLMAFYNDFDIIFGADYDNPFPDAWRIFYKSFDGDVSKLPQNSTLQRNICEYLKTGKKIGYGYGVILFDGEKIINKK